MKICLNQQIKSVVITQYPALPKSTHGCQLKIMLLSFLKLILPIIFPIFPNILLSAVLKMSFRWHSDLDASQLNKNVFYILLGLLFIEILTSV